MEGRWPEVADWNASEERESIRFQFEGQTRSRSDKGSNGRNNFGTGTSVNSELFRNGSVLY